MDEGIQHRRREADRAQQRAERAASRGDHAAYVMATAQAEEALRRRAAWQAANGSASSG